MKRLIEWVEIPTADFTRGMNFYIEVLKLSLQEMDFGTEKMALLPDGEGAIFYKPGYEPSDKGVIISFRVPDSIEKTLGRVSENGGKIVIPKTKIEAEDRGYFALFLDTEGNKIGLYED